MSQPPEFSSQPQPDQIQNSNTWILDTIATQRTDQVLSGVKSLYLIGAQLFGLQADRMRAMVERKDGIKQVRYADSWSGPSYNSVEFGDGDVKMLDSFLQPPAIAVPLEPTVLPEGFSRLYTLQMRFGGYHVAQNSEINLNDVNGLNFLRPVEKILAGEVSLPEDFGITEHLVTTYETPQSQKTDYPDPGLIDEKNYSITGTIWAPTLDRSAAPDPREDPRAYKAWALASGWPILDTMLQAPMELESRLEKGKMYVGTGTVIDQYGSMKPNARTAVAAFDRMCELVGAYVTRYAPQVFTPDSLADVLEIPDGTIRDFLALPG